MRTYQERLLELQPNYDPRHLEAYMRVQYGTLDHLSERLFVAESHVCARCVDMEGVNAAERCAQSYGL